ncbi:BamA/TamA family outer membrane protein [Flagellimonas meridianipacifica]|uniref:Calcineurin-like phosphoesterase family protein n=1 Tax=Flagellimonas meridianipacifica TaxID=1080225 RepID=A0A2T0MG21_9FLAO|nr:metallophosphoesterase [Allomuricauda pacifica]PRX56504.1 calcineurin-like phosphoesterase family protein [Allomuricauda pacifica]
MKLRALPLILSLLITGCATYKEKYAEPFQKSIVPSEKAVEHTFYLIGDAGKSPMGGLNPALEIFKSKLKDAPKESTALFLGDNIYPAGMPDQKDDPEGYKKAKNSLDAQFATLDDFKGDPIFIPGNHDWYSDGLKGLKRQEEYIKESLGSKKVFQPKNGCPIEKIEISDNIIVIAIDSDWYLVDWDKHPTINDECEIKDRVRFFEEYESLIKKNLDKTIIVAIHHPMFTYGSHGGYYSFKQHLYPTSGKVPLPILGSIANFLRKTSGVSIEDQSNQMNNRLKNRLVTLSQFSNKVVFVSGHEHTLQYVVEEGIPQIVSGAGAKTGATKLRNGSKFSTGRMGYAVLKVFADGSSAVDYFGPRENGTEEFLFSSEVLPADLKGDTKEYPKDFPKYKEASVYSEEEIKKTGFHNWLWGERYRKYYGTKVKAPTVLLDTLYGGLKVVRKGGGNQSNSLRLQHSDGRQFVMRGLRKSAERYLQAIAFQEQYIIGEFDESYTKEFLLSLYTAAHPYAPFTIGDLSDAVGIYHTNPKLFYIPKQSTLGDFNNEFGDGLYMIEEHVSDGHGNLSSFGYSNKIESTYDLIKKLRKDEKYKLDGIEYVKARLFDILIGDWDRHIDQWRWAEVDDPNGGKIFKPIPRDRDQAFSIWGDGLILGIGSKTIPALKIFEGFGEEVRNVKGFTSSPRTFALDMAILSETDLDMWVKQAKYIQEKIDEEVIDKALQNFPEEVRDETVQKIKSNLLSRKKTLVEIAKEYYRVLNKFSVVTGTDKDDYFSIRSLPNGNLEIMVYRIKGGEKEDLFFNKTYSPEQTKEVWIYGLDDKDVFDISTPNSKIKIRVVGGQNNDVYKIAEKSRKVHTYDFKSKKNTYDQAYSGKTHELDDYDTNNYVFEKVKASNNQLLPAFGFNPDDGIILGLTNTYTFNGFRQNPFTQRHTIDGGFYFATSGFDLGYNGEFAHVFENVNLEIDARFTSPNFAINFFGFGNETENNDDTEELEFDFNRVKIQTIKFKPSLVWRGRLGSKVRLGISYENYDVEETEGRFIEGFFTDAGRDTEQDFFGVDAEYSYSNADNEAFPTLGMSFTLQGGYTMNATDTDRAFAYIIPSLAFVHKLTSDGRLVLATNLKGHVNFGDDFEFYQGASIGANNGLRGFRFQRFTGKSAYFQNTDLRYSFRRSQTGLLPVTPGIYGGFDYGRVWFPGDSSDKWHNSYGAGFFINGADILSANIGLFNSADGMRFAFGFGFGF